MVRIVGLSGVAMWLLLNLVGWFFCGSYAQVGVGWRMGGFLIWGALLSLGPLLISAPPVQADGCMMWRAPLTVARGIPLLLWLVCLGRVVEVPLNTPRYYSYDAGMIIMAGLLYLLLLTLVALVLGLLISWLTRLLHK